MPALEITTRIGCANNCHYCPQALLIKAYTKRSNTILMSLDTFKTCLDRLPARVDIDFSGFCEPWLNPDCTAMVLYANQRGHRISVFTTLAGLKPEDIEKLSGIPFKQFRVHLPAAENEENIDVNEAYLATLVKLSASPIQAKFHFHGCQLHPKLKHLADRLVSIKNDLIPRAGNLEHPDVPRPVRLPGRISCERGLQYNVLLPNGDVALCCQDYGLKHVIGNLLNDPYESLFKSPVFQQVQQGLKNDKFDILCRHCTRFTCRRILFFRMPLFYYHKLKKVLVHKDYKKIFREARTKLIKPEKSKS